MCNKFSFCQGDVKRILSYRNINPKFIGELSRSNIKPSKIFELLEPLSYEAILLIKAKQRNPVIQRHVADFFEIYNGIRICVSGHDLQRLGVLPGPYYQKVFARVLKAKLEGKIRTKKEELAFIGRLIKNR
jgi:tRNA nucleotidyltransferase (CCA-adding enzyme)